MDKYKDIHEIKASMVDAIKAKLAEGIQSVNAEEMGAAVDMVKDLAQAERDCMEACYYSAIIDAMGEEDGPMGYDRWRYADGRFAPKGRGHLTRGYHHPVPYEEEMYGYTNGRSGSGGGNPGNYSGTGGSGRQNGSSGRSDGSGGRMGYHGHGDVGDLREMVGDLWASADKEQKSEMRDMLRELLTHMERTA